VITVLLLATTFAQAESLEEKKYWKRQKDYLDEHMKVAEKHCKAKFTFNWVDQPTLRSETEKTKHMPHSVCGNIIDAVRSICQDGEEEAATVRAKITGFSCGFAANRTVKLEGGIVKFAGNNVQPNFLNWAKPILLKSL
jgi:hypothetical protein